VVPPTPEGVATALTYAAASHLTTTADRSHPSMRRYPPPVTFGDERVPDAVVDARPPSDLTFVAPSDLTVLIPAAPLVYYLGATVETVPGATPRFDAPGWSHEFGVGRFESSVGSLLERVFHFDCLVRGAGPHGTTLSRAAALDADAAALSDATPAERLEHVVETGVGVTERPPWPLSMSVEPTVENAAALPHLLRDLPVLTTPASEPLETRERLERSLDDFFRAGVDVPAIDLVDAEAGPGVSHGWLAGGVPIDVFDAVPAVYDHRFAARDRADKPLDVDVVCNDTAMTEAFDAVVDVYRTATAVDVTVHKGLTAASLASLFEADGDFVHYVGHCDAAGLRCVDGPLSTSSLGRVDTRAFFLNACGSYYEGLELVRRGSVAGAVTLEAVLDAPARRVSRVFSRLLAAGFDVQRALELARRRIVMSKDYTVVGDGTHRPAAIGDDPPSETRVERLDEGRYRVEHVVRSPQRPGEQYESTLDGDICLVGEGRERTMDAAELHGFLDDCTFPVVFEEDVRSPGAVAERLPHGR
jgi:hypothetical protein